MSRADTLRTMLVESIARDLGVRDAGPGRQRDEVVATRDFAEVAEQLCDLSRGNGVMVHQGIGHAPVPLEARVGRTAIFLGTSSTRRLSLWASGDGVIRGSVDSFNNTVKPAWGVWPVTKEGSDAAVEWFTARLGWHVAGRLSEPVVEVMAGR